jgi:hypothetical protein
MADTKISALPASTTPLAGTEVLPIVQSSTTKQVSVANLTAGRTFDALGMTLTSTDAGATAAPLLELYRDSASPAASDTIGEIEFNGEDSAGNKQAYGLIHASILSPTSTAEQGQLHFETATAGALTEKMIIGTTNLVINEIGAVFNVRIEGDTDANLFYTDATNSNVGIGTSSPAPYTKLAVTGTAGAQTDAKQQITINAPTTTVGEGGGIRINAASGAKEAICVIGVVNNASGNLGSMTFNVYNGGTTVPEWMRISNAGTVTMSSYGVGTATFSAAGVISSVSDETWKIKDGVPVDPDAMLKKLEPGYWFYNDEKKEIFGVDRQLGFYAQNVNAAIGPEAAPEPEEGKPWGYYDRSVLAVTVMSLQKALATIESLTARLTALENK